MGRLAGKTALITGGGQGVGLGIARCFAREGAAVVITGRDTAKLATAAETIEGAVRVFAGDAGVRANAEAAVGLAVDVFGGVDVLVNAAQARRSGVAVEDITEDDMDLACRSGPYATLFHMQAAFPVMQAGGGGSIINFGSKTGMQPMAGIGSYAAAKEAIRGLTRAAALEWGRYRIRVNILNPASLGPGGKAYFDSRPKELARLLEGVPMGRFGDAEADIAPAALFLASDDGRFVTGQTLNADGGQLML